MGKWYPEHPGVHRFTGGWDDHLYEWGVPFEWRDGECWVTRREDARAIDAVIRLSPYGYDGGFSETGKQRWRKNRQLRRAAFERGRRDFTFLEALEAIAVASVGGSVTNEGVLSVLDQQLPENRALAWRYDVTEEEAAQTLAAAAQQHLDAPTAETAQTLRTAINVFESYCTNRQRRLKGEDET
jgi:hypothetical protein